jgi:hypothetical protein
MLLIGKGREPLETKREKQNESKRLGVGRAAAAAASFQKDASS